MQIFTYCSYRGSRYGFQYGRFDSGSKDIAVSFKSTELVAHGNISKEFMNWCEKKSGWQLVLVKSKNKLAEESILFSGNLKQKISCDRYLLMLGQLEKSRELEKYRRSKFGEVNASSIDSIFYMTLGFLGNATEIEKLASFLIDEFCKDGYQELFNKLEQTISKSKNAERYEINTELFNSVFNDFNNYSVILQTNQNISVVGSFVNRVKKSPNIYLSISTLKGNDTRKIRKEKIKECMNVLSGFDRFSGSVPLLIAYNYFNVEQKVNIRIDYEYLWKINDKV